VKMRQKRLLKSSRVYWGVIAADVVMRFFWMLTLLPEDRPTFGHDLQVSSRQ
jgi:hypothetical protein